MEREIQTTSGPKTIRVCDYCQLTITSGHFCSAACARSYLEKMKLQCGAQKSPSSVSAIEAQTKQVRRELEDSQ